jgi:nucleoid-associated protein YgaU
MSHFMHTVRWLVGLSLLAGGAVLAQPFAAAVLAVRQETGTSAVAAESGMQAGLPAAMIGAGAHAIPDARSPEPAAWAGDNPALEFVAPSPPPAPLPPSGLDFSPPSPALDGTYRSTVEIPPPPLLDVQSPPPLAAGWSVHDVPRPAAAPTAPIQPAAATASYVVRDGDDLTGIALHVYGHVGAATAIWEANRDRLSDPQLLPIGLSLRMPPSWTLPAAQAWAGNGAGQAIEPTPAAVTQGDRAGRAANPPPDSAPTPHGVGLSWLRGGAASNATATPAAVAGAFAAEANPLAMANRPATVRVGMGDSLGSIARRFYGDTAMASRIWQANRDRLRSPDLLVPGIELRLP